MSPVVSTQSDSFPTAESFFPSCPAGPANAAGCISCWMANGVGDLGWNVQEARTNPKHRAVNAMGPGLCDIVSLIERATVVTSTADGSLHYLYISEYHASHGTLLGETLV